MDNYTLNYDNQGGPMPVKPDNNLILAIICTACCCLPAGIYAIIKANDVNNLYAMGRYDEAVKASAEAKKWSLIGMGASAVIWVLYILFYVVIFGFAFANGGFN
jgi:hypothetical protein